MHSNPALRHDDLNVMYNKDSPLLAYVDDNDQVETGCSTSNMTYRHCFVSLVETSKDGMYVSFHNILASSESIVSDAETKLYRKVQFMLGTAAIGIVLLLTATNYDIKYYVKPPKLPVGPYQLRSLHDGPDFFSHYYTFMEGPDSPGSNGYNSYLSQDVAYNLDITNVTWEMSQVNNIVFGIIDHHPSSLLQQGRADNAAEPFVYTWDRHQRPRGHASRRAFKVLNDMIVACL